MKLFAPLIITWLLGTIALGANTATNDTQKTAQKLNAHNAQIAQILGE